MGSLPFFEVFQVVFARAKAVLEVLYLVAQQGDMLRFRVEINDSQGVGEVMGLNIRLEVVELYQGGVHVSLHDGMGLLELIDVGVNQLKLLEHLVNFFGMQVLQHRIADEKVLFNLHEVFGGQLVHGLGIGLDLFFQGIDALQISLGCRLAGDQSYGYYEECLG